MPDNPVPDWLQIVVAAIAPIGAVFTTAGVIGALYVVLRDNHRYREDQRRASAEATAGRADQARLIVIVRDFESGGVIITVQNHSPLPVLDLDVLMPTHPRVDVSTAQVPSRWDSVLSMGVQVPIGPRKRPSLASGGMFEVSFAFMIGNREAVEEDHARFAPKDAICTIQFTDANGVRWSKTNADQPLLVLEADGI